MRTRPDRRAVLAALAALAAAPARSETMALTWDDLVPQGAGTFYESLRMLGVVQHGELSTPFDQELGAKLTHDYDGRMVRLPGFAIPLDFDGTGATTLILAPYVGACIHVPPPPPNQLVLVTTDAPYESDSLFDPVAVTGRFSTLAAETDLAEIGYAIAARRIEPHEFEW